MVEKLRRLRPRLFKCNPVPLSAGKFLIANWCQAREKASLKTRAETRQERGKVVTVYQSQTFDVFTSVSRMLICLYVLIFYQSKRFVAELSRVSEREYNSLFTVDQMRGIAKVTNIRECYVVEATFPSGCFWFESHSDHRGSIAFFGPEYHPDHH